ncbi:MAG: BON domain-containing protein [Acidobacteriota bacterium]
MTVPLRLKYVFLPVLTVVFASVLSMGVAAAQNPAPNTGPGWSQEQTQQIAKEVQKRLGSLAYYSVFDWITFDFHDKTLVLKGYAGLPRVKSSAGNVVKGIKGVEAVDNQIEVLPTSMMDDRVRTQVYNRIYTQPALRRYNGNQGGVRQATRPQPSVARMAGGILYDPPIGYNAIHIIVKNGNVALYGVVDSESDKNIAGIQTKTVPGVFSVVNNLMVAQNPSKKK